MFWGKFVVTMELQAVVDARHWGEVLACGVCVIVCVSGIGKRQELYLGFLENTA